MRGSRFLTVASLAAVTVSLGAAPGRQQPKPAPPAAPNPKLEQYKKEVAADIDGMRELTQQMNDQVFSFGELGFSGI
jgi:hypothetical protein